jgi:hypothetical protein
MKEILQGGFRRYALEKIWSDSEGNLFYNCEFPFMDPAYLYQLLKIHADNQTLERNLSEVGYPTVIDNTAGDDYFIFHRQ